MLENGLQSCEASASARVGSPAGFPCVSSDGAAGPRLNNNQLYKFSYTTEVLVDRTRGSKEGSAGYRISSDVGVNLVWRDPSSKDDQLIQVAVCRSTHMLRQHMMSSHISDYTFACLHF